MQNTKNLSLPADTYNYSTESAAHTMILKNYLTAVCKGCSETPCLLSHKGQSMRRVPILYPTGIWNYQPSLCNNASCTYKDICLLAHSPEEISFHPLRYKTQPCVDPMHTTKHPKDLLTCPHAHNDLRIPNTKLRPFEVDRYKTLPCNITCKHNHKICDMYHQVKDRRRDPELFVYSPVKCSKIECNDDQCEFSHNDFESQYHHENYKTELCRAKPCKVERVCPYLHEEEATVKEDLAAERQLNELSQTIKMLEKMIEAEEEKKKKFEKYRCGNCIIGAPEAVLECGHLVCGHCFGSCKHCGLENISAEPIKNS